MQTYCKRARALSLLFSIVHYSPLVRTNTPSIRLLLSLSPLLSSSSMQLSSSPFFLHSHDPLPSPSAGLASSPPFHAVPSSLFQISSDLDIISASRLSTLFRLYSPSSRAGSEALLLQPPLALFTTPLFNFSL